MAAPTSFLEAPIPRTLLWLGTPIAALVLVGFFVFMGFPYDRLAESIGQQVSAATGTEVSISGLEPRITIGGPGFRARDVRVTTAGRRTYHIDPLGLRPAWSTSWLRGRPALQVELESAFGNADGTLTVGAEPAWDGELADVDLAGLPLPLPAGLELAGRLRADASLALSGNVPSGVLAFEAHSGRLGHPQLPIEIEYESLSGDLVLGGESLAEIRSLRLDGPLLVASAAGDVKRGRRPGQELLDIRVELEIKSPQMQGLLRGLGVALDAAGRASFTIAGTAASPRVR